MLGVYRKKIADMITRLSLVRDTRLGQRWFRNAYEVYQVNDNEVIATGTTPRILFGELTRLLIVDSDLITIVDEPEDKELESLLESLELESSLEE